MSRLQLIIDSNLEDVFLVGLTVSRICEHLRMNTIEAYQVELCAVEAVTNAIRHAYGNQTGNPISVTLVLSPDRLEVEVTDTGAAMPAHHQQRLVAGSDVLQFDERDTTSLPEGGMGLQIMHEAMDEVCYRSEGEVNSIQLIRLLRGIEAGAGQKEPVGAGS